MNSAIGIDLVELAQLKPKASESFVKRILSEGELELYQAISHPQKQLEFLAGRFAAKEAYTKVYQTFDVPLNFKDVSILKNEKGAPYVQSKYRPKDRVLVSISHTEHYAVAICQLVE